MNDVINNEEQKSKTFQRRRRRLFLISQLQLPAGPSGSLPIPLTLLGACYSSLFSIWAIIILLLPMKLEVPSKNE